MTDRTLSTVSDLDALDFDRSGGLLPVVVQDAATGEALMLAFANRAALEKTLETGQMHFWSRSRNELWRKGETSGNTLALVSLHTDCDSDTVLARVTPAGPTCHTGERSCFGDGADVAVAALARLDRTLATRERDRPEGSYTVRLLDDPNLRLKKLGEETAELIAALATRDSKRAVEEAADLVYHVLVALRATGVDVSALLEEMDRRA
ncbi:MAG: bifunctional phosphoribosyl-AMP cyclohydrolase/phosphoribosyl-ATP diphosphatase HisIE [Gemmatimonadetes bacterium]|nr:bifunctional phosphoribosyl-AMP cyclohydrolase/phosphoribosyl-ATP diphosphatase HisIE [Gemmatimonadota bacterium]